MEPCAPGPVSALDAVESVWQSTKLYAPAVFTIAGPVDVAEAVAVREVAEIDRLLDWVEVVEMLLVEIVELPKE